MGPVPRIPGRKCRCWYSLCCSSSVSSTRCSIGRSGRNKRFVVPCRRIALPVRAMLKGFCLQELRCESKSLSQHQLQTTASLHDLSQSHMDTANCIICHDSRRGTNPPTWSLLSDWLTARLQWHWPSTGKYIQRIIWRQKVKLLMYVCDKIIMD